MTGLYSFMQARSKWEIIILGSFVIYKRMVMLSSRQCVEVALTLLTRNIFYSLF